MIPLARPYFGTSEEAAVEGVLRSRWVAQGPRVTEFERAFAEAVGACQAVAMSSCTAALHLTHVALGIGPGDEVICPSLSFIATANSIIHAGARPVFCDVDEQTWNVDPAMVERLITPRTKALLVVHQLGLPADLDALCSIAQAHRLLLIEDAACALGATYRGVPIGEPHGVAACFSFHPRKLLTTGEGGMVTTSDSRLADRLRALRNHGINEQSQRYSWVGYNFRMTDVQAAIGLVQLQRFRSLLERRIAQANAYTKAFANVPGVVPPNEPQDRQHAFQSYVVRIRGRKREDVAAELSARGIQTRPGLMAAHHEPAYATEGCTLAVSDALAEELLAIPIFHEMTDSEQATVIEALRAAMRS